jgi:hypothetical protein
MRDSDGFVLCHHGRPIRCLQCGDEYEAELSRGVDGGPLAHPEADMPANTDSSSPASSPPERSEGRDTRWRDVAEAVRYHCGKDALVEVEEYVMKLEAARALPPEPSNG